MDDLSKERDQYQSAQIETKIGRLFLSEGAKVELAEFNGKPAYKITATDSSTGAIEYNTNSVRFQKAIIKSTDPIYLTDEGKIKISGTTFVKAPPRSSSHSLRSSGQYLFESSAPTDLPIDKITRFETGVYNLIPGSTFFGAGLGFKTSKLDPFPILVPGLFETKDSKRILVREPKRFYLKGRIEFDVSTEDRIEQNDGTYLLTEAVQIQIGNNNNRILIYPYPMGYIHAQKMMEDLKRKMLGR